MINDSTEERVKKGRKEEVMKRDLKTGIRHVPNDHSKAEKRRKPTCIN